MSRTREVFYYSVNNPHLPTLLDYSQWLTEAGVPTFAGASGTAWTTYFSGSLLRLPMHCTSIPTDGELHALFRRKYFIASYLIPPTPKHAANTWLYIADAEHYDIEKLSKAARRDIRRAQRTLEFSELSWDALQANGEPAFCETRQRLGLQENTRDDFNDFVTIFSRNPAHHVFGAWLDKRLIAFATVAMVEGWIEIKGLSSTDADRSHCPSDGLYHYLIHTLISSHQYQVICNGILSPKPGEPLLSLHHFKLKTGFQAIPVYRAFAMPRFGKLVTSPLAFAATKLALRLAPHNRQLEKVDKALSLLRYSAPLPTPSTAAEPEST